jgi:hypothetical protein
MMNSTPWAINDPMNSSKSGARSMKLSPKELHGCDALFWRAGKPLAQIRPLSLLLFERGHTNDALQLELHVRLGDESIAHQIVGWHAALPCPYTRPRTEASMSWIVANIHRIMILSGVLTMTMVYAALAPEVALRSTFGESVSGPVADIVVRNWGALIALVGAMLIYGARKPAVRPLALTVAGASKAIFIALVLSHGGRFL